MTPNAPKSPISHVSHRIPDALPMLCEWARATTQQREFSKYIYSYARVSTIDQASSGLGLEAYKASIEATLPYLKTRSNRRVEDKLLGQGWPNEAAAEAAKYAGYTYAGHYVDEAESARTTYLRDRPAGKALFQRVRPGDIIIFPKLDRAFRNYLDFRTTEKEWSRGPVAMWFCDLGIDTSDGALHKLLLGVMSLVAEWLAESGRERTKEALEAKKLRGDFMGQNRFGTMIKRWIDREGRKRSKEVLIRQEVAKLRWIAWVRTKTGMSFMRISQHLEERLASREGREVLPERLTYLEEKQGREKRYWTEARCKSAMKTWLMICQDGRREKWWLHSMRKQIGKGRPEKLPEARIRRPRMPK